MVAKANSLTDRHLSLLRAYFLVMRRVDRFPWLIWIPTGWLGFIRVPVLTAAVRVFVSSHIRRALDELDRAYQRRLAIDDPSAEEDDWKSLHEQADWKKLQEQAKSMDAGLTPFLFMKWASAAFAFVLIFIFAQNLPDGELAIKMAAAAVTINLEKLAELAAEPKALHAFSQLVVLVWLTLVPFTPILIYHFRFKRAIFNHPELLTASGLNVAFRTVWKEQSIAAGSLYAREGDLFAALGDPVLPEVPVDLLVVTVAYLYHAVGPGLFVGIVAWQAYAVNRSVGKVLFVVAAINAIIGLGAALVTVGEIRQRSKSQMAG